MGLWQGLDRIISSVRTIKMALYMVDYSLILLVTSNSLLRELGTIGRRAI